MYNADLKDAFFPACLQVDRKQPDAIGRFKCVQIKHPVYRQFKINIGLFMMGRQRLS
jgi:hypothetical protein